MAILLINKGGTIPELIGLSSDTKPTVNMPAGAKFTESDTGKEFKFSGATWFPLVIATSITGSLANIPVQEQNALTSSVDTIDVAKMSPDGVNLVMSGVVVTTTVSAIPVLANGFKHVAIQIEGSAFTSGNFAFALQGCEIIAGNYGSIYKQKDDGTFSTALGIPAISTNATFLYIFPNIGVNYLKLTATRTTDGTLSVRVLPFN